MRGYRPSADSVPLKATDGIAVAIDRPFVLAIGLAFQGTTIILALSLLVQAGLMTYDIEGDNYDQLKDILLIVYIFAYSLYVLWMALAPFYSLKTKKPKQYAFYQHPYIHILGEFFACMMACPDLLFDDDDIN